MNIHAQQPTLALTCFSLILAFAVITLGAFTRLTDAGLGCPDWPGCYGQWLLPSDPQKQIAAQGLFPERPIEASKAWTEMIHRYAAGTLGIVIVLIASLLSLRKPFADQQTRRFAWTLVGLVVFQACLGMWTVTWQLHPLVVMAHLLGGMAIFASLSWLYCRLQQKSTAPGPIAAYHRYRPWAIAGMIILVLQIALGGWVSANYAGLACYGFPLCSGELWPNMAMRSGFQLLHPIGVNYEFGLLDNPSRVAIHMAHRVGALVTIIYWSAFIAVLLTAHKRLALPFHQHLAHTAYFMVALLTLQVSLGIINVYYFLPLPVAVAHNGVAALLLAVMVKLIYLITPRKQNKQHE